MKEETFLTLFILQDLFVVVMVMLKQHGIAISFLVVLCSYILLFAPKGMLEGKKGQSSDSSAGAP